MNTTTLAHGPLIETGRALNDLIHRLASPWRAHGQAKAQLGELCELQARQTWHLQGTPGMRIECLHGCVWITQDGDCRDVVLDGGQCFLADRRSGLLLQALDAAQVRVRSPLR